MAKRSKRNKRRANSTRRNEKRRGGDSSIQFDNWAGGREKSLLRAVRYDAAAFGDDLARHWTRADSRSVDYSLDWSTRQTLRTRSRYEVANNSYAFGAAMAIVNASIGTGPRLQCLSPFDEFNAALELAFSQWAQEIALVEKLRAMRFSRFQDGEAFALLTTNPKLEHAVKLDVKPIDCERVCSETLFNDPLDIDGVHLDQHGNVVSYRVLNYHPGDYGNVSVKSALDDAKTIPAEGVLHWFRRTSSEQHRGAPEIATALPLFALLRRYTLAVVRAAETAADFAAVLYSDTTENTDQASPFENVDIARGMATVLPEGWKIGQVKAEQPTSTYGDFKREILGEIGRSLQIPVNVISGNSSHYNYASGRLDAQDFRRMIRVEQEAAAQSILAKIIRAWFQEWRLTTDYRVFNIDRKYTPPVVWFFDGMEHVDPVKEAAAQSTRLASMTTSLAYEYAKQGRDWEDELKQIARERKIMKELGLEFNVATKRSRRTKSTSTTT